MDVVLCRPHSERYLRAFLMVGVNPARTDTSEECVTCAFEAYDRLAAPQSRTVAVLAHHGKLDKGQEPYIGHPARVAAAVAAAGYGDEVQAVAWLHDVVEDTAVSLDDLRGGFSEDIVA